jgi:hypothetical protein
MDRSAALVSPARLVRGADRLLRFAGHVRLALVLLVLAAVWNALAPLATNGPSLLATPPHLVLLWLILLTGLAGVAMRAPAASRVWRSPGPVTEGRETLAADGVRIALRGERFDFPVAELARLRGMLAP